MRAENVLIFPDEERKYRAKLSDFGYSVVMNAKMNSLLLGGTRPWTVPEAKTAVKVWDTKYGFRTIESPPPIAVQNDAFQLADSFVSLGADINFATFSSGHLTLTNPTTILGHVISNTRNSIARRRYLLGSASTPDRLYFIVEPTRQWTALHRVAASHIDTDPRGTDIAEAAQLDWADVDWGANREVLNELLRQFSDSEQLNATEQSMGLTTMHLAVLAGNDAAAILLLDHGARSDVPSAGAQSATAAALALRIQREGLSTIEESARPSTKELAARNEC
ncbi:hypothetical protein EDB81DRAFT_914394 [Dactylonectria macrodidyma]|uniref:Uncharacterized protein n=1 Tax=Dactylonectria macrodidyma TaxID=307937 RepID=A0A9P9IIE1_9HYPO|nr:hypothetical protein EDB81DRAFT_914394 [Dactylonectria macrodidyma]